jgi:hypothetical protein
MALNQYAPFDLIVAVLFLALACFTAVRARRKFAHLLADRRMAWEQLNAASLSLPPAQQNSPTGGPRSGMVSASVIHIPSNNLPHSMPGAYNNYSFNSVTYHHGVAAGNNYSAIAAVGPPLCEAHGGSGASHRRQGTAIDPLLPPSSASCELCSLTLPPVYKDRRFSTFLLLALVTVYCLSRTVLLTLGAFDTVPMDGTLEAHFYTVVPALMYMALQTSLIARWARHVIESEKRHYGRTFRMGVAAVYVSTFLDIGFVIATIIALIDYKVQATRLSATEWNQIQSAVSGGVYTCNGIIFIALGVRLFVVWKTSSDPLLYNAAIENAIGGDPSSDRMAADAKGQKVQAALPGGVTPDPSNPHQAELARIRTSLTSGCTRNGSRGTRILSVAFIFGFVCFARGVALLAFMLESYDRSIHQAVHNDAAPTAVLLIEFASLAFTLRMLMPPGSAEGDRDPDARAAFRYSDGTMSDGASSYAPSRRSIASGLYDSRSTAAHLETRDSSAGAALASGAKGANLPPPRNAPHSSTKHHQRPRGTAHHSEWGDAHALEGYVEGSPNGSWRVAEQTDDGAFKNFDSGNLPR